MKHTGPFLSVLLLFSLCLAAQEDEEFDELSLILELDAMDTAGVRKLADRILAKPGDFSAADAILVLSHPNLDDANRARRLYRAFKGDVAALHYEILAESPFLDESKLDPVVTPLLLRLVGLTKHPDAKELLVDRLRWGDPVSKAAAAHATGLYGDKGLLPLLRKELQNLQEGGAQAVGSMYGDGLLRGLLHLGEAQYLPRLLTETAAAARAVARTVLTVASGYTPPDQKRLARRRLPGLRQRHRRLELDIVDIAPIFSRELAKYIVEVTDPDVCDVLYRRLPELLSDESYAAFIPALRARCWDLRQLILDVLMDGKARPQELPTIRNIVLEWRQGEDPVGRAWAVRNAWALDAAARRRVLVDALENGNRWEQVAAIREVRRAPDQDLLGAARALAGETVDPDVRFDLARLFVACGKR